MLPWIPDDMLPLIFAGLMGFTLLLYGLLDGLDPRHQSGNKRNNKRVGGHLS